MAPAYRKKWYLLIWAISIALACQKKVNIQSSSQYNDERKKVQALLLTQPFSFDHTDKNKISGSYIANEQVVVPKDLPPQNKWVMFEGPVLENDLIAYRFYLDSRHRNDIYGKRVTNLVMDTVSWNYHNIMDWGADILKVGESLGIGSPAVWYRDSLYTLSDYGEKIVQITKNEADSANIRMTFKDLKIANVTLDVVQDWSLNAGEPWCEISLEVTKGVMPQGMHFGTGIVRHLEDCQENAMNGFHYAFTWGPQSFHAENMGMALILPERYQPQKISNDFSHAFIFQHPAKVVNYRFMAAWERDVMGIKTSAAFQQLIETACTK